MSNAPITQGAVMAALSRINDPELHQDIVSLGMVQGLQVEDGRVAFRFVLTTPACPVRDQLKEQAEAAVRSLPGVEEVAVEMGAQVRAYQPRQGPDPIPGVRNAIAVASNKGGVGKSTLAVNLAVALAKVGARVGLVDADITGPNIPTMVGLEPGFQAQEGLAIVERYGLRVASIGFVLPKGQPVLWRGPIIGSTVRQLLLDLPWGEDGDLDYLIIDLPPGTSDAAMSMCREAAIAGVVIISTPQAVSLEDATKAVGLFERMEVPVFGLVENMSYLICPHCGDRIDVFGYGGVRKAAAELGGDFLGEIPLNPGVRAAGDAGVPIVEAAPDSPVAQAFFGIAQRVAAKASVQRFIDAQA